MEDGVNTTDTQEIERIQRPPEGAITNIAQLITAIEEGQFNADVTKDLLSVVHELNDALLIQRKAKASITIKLSLTADRGVIETTAEHSVKRPPTVRTRTMMYVANAHFLSKRDPRQPDLPLRTVDTGPAPELRTVG